MPKTRTITSRLHRGKSRPITFRGDRGVRVDSHVYAEYVVPPNYDSMIAKLIVSAPTRQLAIQRARRALDEFVVEGIKTTIPLLQRIIRHERFLSGQFSTNFLAEHFS